MWPVADIAAGFVIVGEVGMVLLRADGWFHSPAKLKADIERIDKRLDTGNTHYSAGMSKITTKIDVLNEHVNRVDVRLARLEGASDERREHR